MGQWLGFLLLALLAAITVVAMVSISSWLGPRRRGPVHDMPFESGVQPKEIVQGRFSIKFFVVALLFILFDIELVFLFPWAVVFRDLGLLGFVEMLIFLLVVLAGLFYSIKRGVLEWK